MGPGGPGDPGWKLIGCELSVHRGKMVRSEDVEILHHVLHIRHRPLEYRRDNSFHFLCIRQYVLRGLVVVVYRKVLFQMVCVHNKDYQKVVGGQVPVYLRY